MKSNVTCVSSLECVKCGESNTETSFYSNSQSNIYSIKKRVPLCKECLQKLLEEYTVKFGEQNAVFALCAVMDMPYLPERYKKITEDGQPFAFWKYTKVFQAYPYNTVSFADSVLSRDIINDIHSNNETYALQEDLNRLHEDFIALREDIHEIKANLDENKNSP